MYFQEKTMSYICKNTIVVLNLEHLDTKIKAIALDNKGRTTIPFNQTNSQIKKFVGFKIVKH